MPLVYFDDEDVAGSQIVGPVTPPAEPARPSTVDTLGAAFRQDNLAVSAVGYLMGRGQGFPPQPGYDPLSDPAIEPFAAEGLEDFVTSESPEETAFIIERKKREAEDRRTLAAAGLPGLAASMAAGVLSPDILLPGGAIYRSARMGRSAARSAVSVGLATAAGATVAEGALQATQYDRPVEESALAIGGGAILGGIIGGGAGAFLSRADYAKASKAVEEYLNADDLGPDGGDLDLPVRVTGQAQPAGAQAAGEANLGDSRTRAAGGLGRAASAARLSPLNVLQQSEISAARNVARDFEAAMPVRATNEGIVQAVGGNIEGLLKQEEARKVAALEKVHATWYRYRFDSAEPTRVARMASPFRAMASPRGEKLSYNQFRQEVGRALRRGDRHEIPAVAEAAKIVRAEFDRLLKDAQRTRLLPENVRVLGAETWLHRSYNTERILAERVQFKSIIADWMAEQQRARLVKVQSAEAAVRRAVEADANSEDARRLMQAYEFLKGGRRAQEPASLARFVRREGGVQDEGGEISAMFGAKNRTGGLLRREGISLDDMARRAWQAGYIEEHDVNEFLDALRRDVSGDRVYSRLDEIEVEQFRSRQEAREVLDAFGVTLRDTAEKARAKAGRAAAPSEDDYGITDVDAFLDEGETLSDILASPDDYTRLTRGEIETIADEIIDKITGMAVTRAPNLDMLRELVPGPRDALKARTLAIPDEKIEPFLESDIEAVIESFHRSMASDIILTQRYGSVGMEAQRQAILDEAKRLAEAAKTPKEARRIQSEADRAIRNLEVLRDRFRGTFGMPRHPHGFVNRAGSMMLALNYMTYLGSMTVAALSDAAYPVMKFGLLRTFRRGWVPFARGLAGLESGGKAMRGEIAIMRPAVELVTHHRSMEIAHLLDDYRNRTLPEKLVQGGASRFGLIALMSPWNEAMKQITALTSVSYHMDAIEALAKGKATAKQRRMLAQSSIAENEALEIWERVTDGVGGVQVGGRWYPQAEVWEGDRGRYLREVLASAVIRDVDSAIVTPGMEKPVWADETLFGRMALQFKSFAFAANQRILLAGLSRRESELISGTILALALGALVAHMRENLRGESTADWSAEKWAVEATDWSGITGALMEVNNIAEMLTRGRVGLSAITGEQASRYRSRNEVSALLGPTFGRVQDAVEVTGAVSAGDLTRADIRRIRRAIPLQNLFYIRSQLDRIEDAVGDALDLPEAD